MRTWSISLGRLFGVEIRLHVTFLFLLGFVWLLDPLRQQPVNYGRGLALVGIVFVSVALHEIGHALARLHSGTRPRALMLMPLGGIALNDPEPLPDRRADWLSTELRSAPIGPLVNAAIAACAAVMILGIAPEVNLMGRPFIFSGNLPRSLVWVNVALAAINFLPAYPSDGGRVLRALLARRMNFRAATRRAVMIGQGFSMAFIFAGMWNVWFTALGLLLFFAGQIEERSLVFQSVLETVRMEDVMLTDFSTLSPADTLQDALSKAVHTLQDDFPVVRGSDMVGVISRHNILEALRSDGNAYVQSVMNRAYEVAQKGESLASAFGKITSRGLTIIPVVDQERLVGIITLQNLMHSIGLLAETRRLRTNDREA